MRGVPDSQAAFAFYRSLPPVAFTTNALRTPSAPQSQGLDAGGLGVPLQVFVCVGVSDPVLGEPVMQSLASKAWGESSGYWWHTIGEAGHFVQEVCVHVRSLIL